MRWEYLAEDFPSWPDVADEEMSPEVDQDYSNLLNNTMKTEVGGWPSLVQSELDWLPPYQHPITPEFVFQIDSESAAAWMWGDAGVGYFGRGTGEHKDVWLIDWQCY